MSAAVQVGQFGIWPDSDSGSRPNALRIERGDECLVLSSTPTAFHGQWSNSGFFIWKATFAKLTPKEGEMLRTIGSGLPPGMSTLSVETTRILQERVDKIGSKNLEETFAKVFKICQKESGRTRRPRFLRWLPI